MSNEGITGGYQVTETAGGVVTKRESILLLLACGGRPIADATQAWHDGTAESWAIRVTADGMPDINIGWPEFIAWLEAHR